jgi:hypothetical protein
LGAIAVASLVLLGWAIFYVGKGRKPRTASPAAATEEPAAPEREVARKAPPSLPRKVPVGARSVGQDDPAEALKQAQPETLDEARKAFDAYIVELDGEIKRLEASGGRLSEDVWKEYRTRGVDAISHVLRLLDHQDPTMIEEIRQKQEDVRSRLDRLEPR